MTDGLWVSKRTSTKEKDQFKLRAAGDISEPMTKMLHNTLDFTVVLIVGVIESSWEGQTTQMSMILPCQWDHLQLSVA